MLPKTILELELEAKKREKPKIGGLPYPAMMRAAARRFDAKKIRGMAKRKRA